FNDPNSNGTFDGADAAMPGWQVYLDLNNDNRADADEPATQSDTFGNYAFGTLPAGTYHVKQVTQIGYRKTRPASGTAGYDVTLAAGESATGKNFAVTTNIFLAGKVFNDINSNGVQDAGEAGIAGLTLNIRSNNVIVTSRTTDANGAWQVKGLA